MDSFCEDLPRVSEDTNKKVGGPLSLEKLGSALLELEGGEAPGIDGLPLEFYKALWTDLREDILNFFNGSFNDMSLPQSCRREVLTAAKEGRLAGHKDLETSLPIVTEEGDGPGRPSELDILCA